MTDLQLDTLEARGLIRLASLQPELEYLFRHALLQDTAYESLLKQERRALHQVVGATLEELYPERVGELAAVLAMHFEQAGDTDKAVDYLTRPPSSRSSATRSRGVRPVLPRCRACCRSAPTDEPRRAAPRCASRSSLDVLEPASRSFLRMKALAMIEPLIPDARALGDLRLEADLHLTVSLMRAVPRRQPGRQRATQALARSCVGDRAPSWTIR